MYKTYFAHSGAARNEISVWLGIIVFALVGVASAYGMRTKLVSVIGVIVSAVALVELVRSLLFNHTWTFRVYGNRIAWSAPYRREEVNSEDVEAAHFDNVGESNTLFLLKKDEVVLRIHYHCFGAREGELIAALLEQSPGIIVTKAGETNPSWASWHPFRRKQKRRDN